MNTIIYIDFKLYKDKNVMIIFNINFNIYYKNIFYFLKIKSLFMTS